MQHVTFSSLRETQPFAHQTLTHALTTDRLHHAYVLVAREETTSQHVAWALCQRLVCHSPNDQDACGECAGCRKILGGNHTDVIEVLPNDKGTIVIDAIRTLNDRLNLRAIDSTTRVVLIARADLMNPAAQNALLKTLEEPPDSTCFVLTAARYKRLLPTVRSRSQAVRLAPAPLETTKEQLKEAGIPESLIGAVARLIGPDTERAAQMLEAGLEEAAAGIKEALTSHDAISSLDAASDLGRDKQRTELSLALIELWVRDRLASRLTKGANDPASIVERKRLTQTADRLMTLRRLAVYNVNRTLALESVLLTLRGEASA